MPPEPIWGVGIEGFRGIVHCILVGLRATRC